MQTVALVAGVAIKYTGPPNKGSFFLYSLRSLNDPKAL